MARIVLHAGRGKTGSTSLQEWLRVRSHDLRKEAGITTLVASVGPSGDVIVAPHRGGSTNSATIMRHCWDHPGQRDRVLSEFVEGLDHRAHEFGAVLVSGEIFGRAIALGDEDLVGRFDELASSHQMEIAYYVRPQHQELESGWRHWRSQREHRPSEFLERLGSELHHLRTETFVRQHASRLRFTVRPFRRDLLHGGDVVADFAHHFIGSVPVPDADGYWENSGIPVEVSSALAALPPPLPWSPAADHLVLELVKDLLADAQPTDSPRAAHARQVLQQACHHRYEAENRQLLDRLGWEAEHWVPAVDTDIGEATFARMDELWSPAMSEAELMLLRAALGALFQAGADEDRPVHPVGRRVRHRLATAARRVTATR